MTLNIKFSLALGPKLTKSSIFCKKKIMRFENSKCQEEHFVRIITGDVFTNILAKKNHNYESTFEIFTPIGSHVK